MLALAMAASASQLPVSEALLDFTAQAPWEREPILRFMFEAARTVPEHARVLDVGAGDAPYAELFAHTEYVTLDWESSPHEGARAVAVSASADAIPLPDASFDVVVLTQVLEHVRRPAAVLAEIARVLRPGARLLATVPFVWELHEEPHDYWRFTPYALAVLLEDAGLEAIAIEPRSDSLSALAQLMTNVAWTLLGGGEQAERASAVLRELAGEVAALAPLDTRRALPLGYTIQARRPG